MEEYFAGLVGGNRRPFRRGGMDLPFKSVSNPLVSMHVIY